MNPYKREGEGDLTDRRKDWSNVDSSHQKLEEAMNSSTPEYLDGEEPCQHFISVQCLIQTSDF